MTTLTVELAPGISAWSYEDVTLHGGRHDVDTTDRTSLAEAICAAAAAGALVIIGDEPAAMTTVVESDELSLAKYEQAQAARAPLYVERDAELAAAPAEERAAIVEVWEQRMDQAAQEAAELNTLLGEAN
jgi:hypothetical protein